MNNINDSYVDKFHEQSNLSGRYVKTKQIDKTLDQRMENDHEQRTSLNENLHSSANVELCDKIRHFTEEIKGKFKKKKNRSACLSNSTNSKLDYKSNDLSESSDLDELNEQNRSITRIKINQSADEMDYYPNSACSNYFSSHSNLSQSLIHNSNSLSPCLNNFSRNSLSQNSLLKGNNESRSPFINRALPPLPKQMTKNGEDFCLKDDFYARDKNQILKSSTSKRLDFEADDLNNLDSLNGLNKFDNSDDQSDDESKLTSCFKLHKDHKKSQSSNKSNKIKNYLAKKYSHPPPHLHSNSNRNKLVQFDDEEEEENNSNHTNTQSLPTENHSHDQLNSSPKDHEENRKMFDYAKNIEIIKGKFLLILFSK